jgi:glycosyltransferase involved in cell wall biosynthesis
MDVGEKMRVLFLTLVYPTDANESNIYSDLMDEIASRGHEVIVLKPSEGLSAGQTSWRGQIMIVTVRTGKVTKSSYMKKAINTLLLESRYRTAIKAIVTICQPDLLVYSTPPITFLGAVRHAKKAFGCKTYLLLKDIFPANARDMGLIKRGGIVWSILRKKEQALYDVSDRIGCMSEANAQYIISNNPGIAISKIDVCPNSIRPTPEVQVPRVDTYLMESYGIPQGSMKLLYGGNLGKPQGVPFIIEVLETALSDDSLFFVIIGDGTEYRLLEDYMMRRKGSNALLLRMLPKSDYLSLLACMDAGLLFLNHRFTIPNYPSRILEYFDYSLPVLAATDTATDIRELVEGGACGLWSKSDDVVAMFDNIRRLRDDPELRRKMGRKGREMLLTRFTARISADVLLRG